MSFRSAVEKKVPGCFVMDYSPSLWIVSCRIPHVVPVNAEVVGKENADFSALGLQVLYLNLPDVDVLVKIYRISSRDQQAKILIVKTHIGDQRIGNISEIQIPHLFDPREPTVNPHTKATIITVDMILLTHVRKIQIPDSILTVKAYEKSSITYGDVSGHCESPFAYSIRSLLSAEPPARS